VPNVIPFACLAGLDDLWQRLLDFFGVHMELWGSYNVKWFEVEFSVFNKTHFLLIKCCICGSWP
jgi:hypothetical protein